MDDAKELEDLNYEEAKQYIGGVVFISIIMVIGIIGNLHVLYVYTFRIKPSNHRIFILTLAVLDLLTCVIGMPFIIVDLRNPLIFTMVTACKVLRFVNYFICISSASILTVIATDRYRKICVPLGKQISQGMAKLLCLMCPGISLTLSWPAPVLYGHSSVNTTNPNITGVRCSTEDKFKEIKYQAYFNAVLLLVVFGVFGLLVALYSLIGRTIKKQVSFKSSSTAEMSSDVKSRNRDTNDESLEEKSSEFKEDKKSKFREENEKTGFDQTNANKKTESAASSTDCTPIVTNKNKYLKAHPKQYDSAKFNRVKRTTFMFSLITAFFFISYCPHLILKIVAFAKKDFVLNMSFTGKVFYNTFLWCAFINNMVNCFIYGFCDIRFRTEVKNMYNII